MRWTIGIATLAIAGCGAAWAQASPEELALQRSMVDLTFWMTVISAFSAVFAFLGFGGALYAINEQRKLAQAEQRAFLTIKRVTAERMDVGQYMLTLVFTNTGKTHAFRAAGVVLLYQAKLLQRIFGDGNTRTARDQFLKAEPKRNASIDPIEEIAPDEEATEIVVFDVTKTIVKEIESDGSTLSSTLFCLMEYRDAFNKAHHVEYEIDFFVPEGSSATEVVATRSNLFGRRSRKFIKAAAGF